MTEQDWINRPADVQYLLDSGLLFEINRQIMHPCGLALSVKKNDADGAMSLQIKDSRLEPERLHFDKETYRIACEKWNKFKRSFVWPQMDKRAKKLGWSCQTYTP